MGSSTNPKPLVIGITGGSGSGKSSLVKALRASFSEGEVCLLPQDEYYLPIGQLSRDEEGIVNFDLPSALNWPEFERDLDLLLAGEPFERPEYTFNNEKLVPKVICYQPAPVVLVEGVHVFYKASVRDKLDLKVFVHAKENLKIIRRIKRDQIERNYPLDDVLYRYENHVAPIFEKFIEPYLEEADLVVNNNASFDWGLRVLQGYLRDYLKGYGA